jgi:hypothetical protein
MQYPTWIGAGIVAKERGPLDGKAWLNYGCRTNDGGSISIQEL